MKIERLLYLVHVGAKYLYKKYLNLYYKFFYILKII